jgi:predicted DNA-binding transcriptional regulator AlpA
VTADEGAKPARKLAPSMLPATDMHTRDGSEVDQMLDELAPRAAANESELMSILDFCAWAAISEATYHRLRKAGDSPPTIEILGLVRISRSDARAWLKARKRRKATPKADAADVANAALPAPEKIVVQRTAAKRAAPQKKAERVDVFDKPHSAAKPRRGR